MNDIEIDDAVLDVWVMPRNRMNEKIKTSNFNWCAFLFGGYYFLYRKMYLVGILDMVLSIIASILIAIIARIVNFMPLTLISNFIVPIVNGFIFYPLYRTHIKNTLSRNRNFNPIQIAQTKGGVNAGAVGIAIAIMFVLIFVAVFVLLTFGIMLYSVFNDSYYDNYYDYDDYYDYDYDYDDYYDKYNRRLNINGYYFDI